MSTVAVDDLLRLVETGRTAGERAIAAKALLEQLGAGCEMSPSAHAALERQWAEEQDVVVAALLRRALNRIHAERLIETDPARAFDREVTRDERRALEGLVARLRVLVDGARGAGEFDARYQVIREISQGGMARILLGRRRDGVEVAIKVLLEEHSAPAACRARLRREAEILQGIAHPHVVRLHEWGEIGRGLYLVMEYVGGGDLEEWLKRGAVSPSVAREVLLQVLDGLAACHAAGIVHRDVKPANILLTAREGKPWAKLADFGLARRSVEVDGLTREHTVMGTEPYMAPEQWHDPRTVGPAADLYACGVMAYEMLSGGRLPVGDCTPLSCLVAGASAELDAVIERCLAHHPEDRWATAEDLYHAFTAAMPPALGEGS